MTSVRFGSHYPRRHRGLLLRMIVLVLVTLLHVGLFLLWRASSWAQGSVAAASVESSVLRIRFVTHLLRLPASAPARMVHPVPRRSAIAMPKHLPVAKDLRDPPIETRSMVWTEQSASRPSAVADYVAGGRGFSSDLRAAQAGASVTRLPGSSKPLVAGLHMVDPRSQGISGAVRMLGGLFGATDPHCVAVDSWQSLTTQEMLDRHISPDEVDRVAEEYHCRPR